ncbi:hypothetical protein [Halorubellus sp. PRR65]|uniref:DUF7519 family protein n=1 Tax=Halorubellus sp. PRR65 TaxID=3098148 RepID=UPI002B261FDB|nr:hypothetical protein [Halorubellus sp. PRR65]
MTGEESTAPVEGAVAPPGETRGLAATNPGFVVAALTAVVAFAAVAPASWLATTAAGSGTLVLVAGARRGSRPLVSAGSVALAAGSPLAGLGGATPVATALGAWAALVAWDAATYALAVDAQVGAVVDRGVALAHVRDATLVGAAGLAVAATAFLAGAGGAPVVAGVAAVAAVALVLALVLD